MIQRIGKKVWIAAATLGALTAMSTATHAAIIIGWGSTSSFAGTETALTASTYGSGIVASGGSITRTGLGTSSGGGSLNSTGWNNTSNFLGFSITTTADGSYNLTQFLIQDRASGTGPGNLALYYSGDSFANPIATWSDAPSTGTRQETAAITGITLAPSTTYTFEIKAANSTSNAGGTVASAGTYRLISPDVELDGDAVQVSTSAPEPASLGVIGLGAAALIGRRKRKA